MSKFETLTHENLPELVQRQGSFSFLLSHIHMLCNAKGPPGRWAFACYEKAMRNYALPITRAMVAPISAGETTT